MNSVLESLEFVSVVLAALYLRGAPGENRSRRNWPMVETVLRRGCPSAGAVAQALRDDGLWAEAIALERPGLLSWAEDQVSLGRVISVVDPSYPPRWRSLGASAPPVLWRMGSIPIDPLLAIVGSRQVAADVLSFTREVAEEASRLGYSVISGGAVGCDSAARQGASCCLEILPYGLHHHHSDGPALSLCPPDDAFSNSAAMERNALIYAAAEQAVVAHARFREGGAWMSATHALRRRLCPMIVRQDGSPAARALLALGARPLSRPEELAQALKSGSCQRELFG